MLRTEVYTLAHLKQYLNTPKPAFIPSRAQTISSLGGDQGFVPKEAIFLSFISCRFLARPGNISGNFFARSCLGVCGKGGEKTLWSRGVRGLCTRRSFTWVERRVVDADAAHQQAQGGLSGSWGCRGAGRCWRRGAGEIIG